MSDRTVLEMFDERAAQSGEDCALRIRRDGQRIAITWEQWHTDVARFARYLAHLGVSRGDRVILHAQNRYEWVVADLAIMRLGAVVVPVHPDTLPQHCGWTVRHAEATWAIVENPMQLEKFVTQAAIFEHIVSFVLFDALTPADVSSAGRKPTVSIKDCALREEQRDRIVYYADVSDGAYDGALEERTIGSADLATIVYTSGTTGTPRGVQLTHGNLAAEALGNALALPLDPTDRQLLILPLSQVFARATYLTSILVGCEMSISRGFAHLFDEFQEEKPTFFVGVPEIFDQMAGRALTERAGRRVFNPERARGFARLAQKRTRAMQQGSRITLGIVDRALLMLGDRTLFKDFRKLFGGRLRFSISGGAPVSPFIEEAFRGMGVPIYEGYGLTETCGAATVNTPDSWHTGSVGRPLRDVEMKIAPDGEVLIHGSIVSPGYWRDEEATKEAWENGWFRTGDIGAIVGEFLMITDRRCHMMVLRDGKSVSPQRIEIRLQSIPVVRRALVTRREDDRLVAILTLDPHVLRMWARAQGIDGGHDHAALCLRDEVYEELRSHVNRVNEVLRASEQVHRFAIIPRRFSTETGELTTTNRVRRRFVVGKYRRVIEGLSAQK